MEKWKAWKKSFLFFQERELIDVNCNNKILHGNPIILGTFTTTHVKTRENIGRKLHTTFLQYKA